MYRDPAQRTAEVAGAAQRIDPLPSSAVDRQMLGVIERLRELHQTPNSGEVHGFYATLAHSPAVSACFLQLGTELSVNSTIPPRERELAILRVGWLCGAPYEWGEHVLIARRIGLSEEAIARAAEGSAAPGWSGRERAMLRAVEELHADAMISDASWADLADHFDQRQLLELTMLVGHYHLTAFVQNALRIPLSPRNRGLSARSEAGYDRDTAAATHA
jgi:4-carboxymuconolactone decarboxylase